MSCCSMTFKGWIQRQNQPHLSVAKGCRDAADPWSRSKSRSNGGFWFTGCPAPSSILCWRWLNMFSERSNLRYPVFSLQFLQLKTSAGQRSTRGQLFLDLFCAEGRINIIYGYSTSTLIQGHVTRCCDLIKCSPCHPQFIHYFGSLLLDQKYCSHHSIDGCRWLVLMLLLQFFFEKLVWEPAWNCMEFPQSQSKSVLFSSLVCRDLAVEIGRAASLGLANSTTELHFRMLCCFRRSQKGHITPEFL